nr:uncharacterized protein LOC109166667 [Ipomoea trifida]
MVPTPSGKTLRKRRRVDPFEGSDPWAKRPDDFPISARPPRGQPNIPPPRKERSTKRKMREIEEEKSWNSEERVGESEEISDHMGPRTHGKRASRKFTTKEKGKRVIVEDSDVQNSPSCLPKPHSKKFLTKQNATKWDTIIARKTINQKLLVLEKLEDNEQITEALVNSQMLGTVTNIEPYEENVIYEFYSNLGTGTTTPSDPMYGKVYLRGNFYNFTPALINEYMCTPPREEEAEATSEQVAQELTARNVSFEKNKIKAASLTSKYAILQKIALVNWMPSLHENTVKWSLAELLYKIGKGIKVNFGEMVPNHEFKLRKGTHQNDLKTTTPKENPTDKTTLLKYFQKRLTEIEQEESWISKRHLELKEEKSEVRQWVKTLTEDTVEANTQEENQEKEKTTDDNVETSDSTSSESENF